MKRNKFSVSHASGFNRTAATIAQATRSAAITESNPEKFAVMQERLGQILEKHIKQASKEFEEIIKWVDE